MVLWADRGILWADREEDRSFDVTEEKMMTKKDIARRLQCSEPTVNRLLRAGRISYIRVGRQIRFRESDLAGYVARSTQEYFARRG